jgi:hypothetical protein
MPYASVQAPTLVIHGPEVFDAGDAARLVQALRPERVIVAGVMARTAAEESGLSVEYDPRPPSHVLRDETGTMVFLVNHGKNAESGRIFGEIVSSRLAGTGLLHIECSNRTLYCWNGADMNAAEWAAGRIGFAVDCADSQGQAEQGARVIRGCVPGEPVYVEGIVIGTARAEKVVIASEGRRLIPVSGLVPKQEGLEKLQRCGTVHPAAAWCRSGPLRRAEPRANPRRSLVGRVTVIDHCGHELFSRISDETCGMLAIGDDTTAVCGHIGVHLGLPVFGIVDGDRDGVITAAWAPGSVVAQALLERDDDIGTELKDLVPQGPVLWEEWVASVLEHLADRVRIIYDGRRA